MASVAVEVSDPILGLRRIAATYNPSSQKWDAFVPGNALSENSDISVRVVAEDSSYNQGATTKNYHAIVDNVPPLIEVSAPTSGAIVGSLGFRLYGQVIDATRIRALTVTVATDVKDATPNVAVAADGRYSTSIRRGVLEDATVAAITLTALDSQSNATALRIGVAVSGNDPLVQRVIDRATFGAVPGLLDTLTATGPLTYIEQQLDPLGIDDSAFESEFGTDAPEHKGQLQELAISRAIHSRRQLQSIMTLFWDNHFNTEFRSHGSTAFELAEHEAFRSNAFGQFRTLLGISAKSAAMLSYLNLKRSHKQAPNENYPRELLEVHTLGSDGEFSQRDVEEAARAFTGWRLLDGRFAFQSSWHDYEEKVLLGTVLPAGQGQADGEKVLDAVAAHPSTARHVCAKLAELLVSDLPPDTVVEACKNTFLDAADSPDQIAQVLRVIVSSPAFSAPEGWGSKVNPPFEFVIGVARIADIRSGFWELRKALGLMEMPLFDNPLPIGYPEQGIDWINASQLLQRMAFGAQIASDPNRLDILERVRDNAPETPDGVLSYLFELILGEQPDWFAWVSARDILTANGTRDFNLDAPGVEQRLRQTVSAIFGMPANSLQ